MTQPYQFVIGDISLETVQPLTYTHHGVKDLPQMIRGVDAEGKPLRTVYLPAGQLRGRIRHEAALAVMRGRTEKVKLEEALSGRIWQKRKFDQQHFAMPP
jgi:hypothetical protein